MEMLKSLVFHKNSFLFRELEQRNLVLDRLSWFILSVFQLFTTFVVKPL